LLLTNKLAKLANKFLLKNTSYQIAGSLVLFIFVSGGGEEEAKIKQIKKEEDSGANDKQRLLVSMR
jgi:hypothetical protein